MSNRLKLESVDIPDLKILRRTPHSDERGMFERLFCAEELQGLLGGRHIVQVNRSVTRQRGAVRGMHFQRAPHAEIKFITCLRGAVFDVAVDLRASSPTFLKWRAELLSADEPKGFIIPTGFAHGFQALSPNCELLYLHTAAFHPESEGAVNALDPMLGIAWPEPITHRSQRDSAAPMLARDFGGLAQ